MAEDSRTPDPDPKAASKKPDMKEPPPEKPPVKEPEETDYDIIEEDRFQSTDN